jgi:hypothetical protein
MLSDWIIPFVIDDLSAYGRTLDTISSWGIGALIPGHGQPTTDREEIRTRLSQDMAYLAELRKRVSRAIDQGKTVEETVESCADMALREPEAMTRWAHRMNVGQVYFEFGGDADPEQVGWNHGYPPGIV